MPIEIKELVIRATVDQGNQGTIASQSASDSNCGQVKTIKDTVEELMKMIQDKNER